MPFCNLSLEAKILPSFDAHAANSEPFLALFLPPQSTHWQLLIQQALLTLVFCVHDADGRHDTSHPQQRLGSFSNPLKHT